MKIAVLGAGFTGLAAALKLAQKGHKAVLFEKANNTGGLATGFYQKGWRWSLEKSYHHWFTNDYSSLNLAKELGHHVVTVRPKTSLFVNNRIFPFDTPADLFNFPYLSLIDKFRNSIVLAYLKLAKNDKPFRGKKALAWIRKNLGENSSNLIWESLFDGKFGSFKEDIALNWFWARIKKRTSSLSYPEGGFQMFADNIAAKINKLAGEIKLNTEICRLSATRNGINLTTSQGNHKFDKVIITSPSPVFDKISKLPQNYRKKILSIPHLHALILLLILKKPFMKDYWLNITDRSFPFLVLVEHTNFMSPKNYGGQHILYIGNYLPINHQFLSMDAGQLLKLFDPFLKRINKNYLETVLDKQVFLGAFAQPVMTTDYLEKIPSKTEGKDAFKTPLENVYIANMDMVYPWDRGTNYAIEMGERVADIIDRSLS